MTEDRDEEQPGGDGDPGGKERDSPEGDVGSGSGEPDGNGQSLPPWKNPGYRFVFFFLLYLAIIAVAYPPLREKYTHVVDALAAGTAAIQYFCFGLISDSVALVGKVVTYDGFPVKIIEECTGIYEVLIFMAAVLAFPTTMVNKAIGFGMGIPLLYFFNVVRIMVLILVGRHLPEYFDFMHLYFWQATLILMITSVWLLWITKVVKRGESVSTVHN